jgi:hypothetical protein
MNVEHVQTWNAKRLEQKRREAELDALFRPKVIGQKYEDGHLIVVYEPRFAEGAISRCWVR